jgi:hypothetical protein
MEIKELQSEFIGRGQVKGFKFTLKNKTEKGYIYEVDTGSSIHYEVFKKRINKQFNCISYPSDKAFGYWAWSCSDYECALNKLEGFEL